MMPGEPRPLSEMVVPIRIDKFREMLKNAFREGWVARDIRSVVPQRWTQVGDEYKDLVNVDQMIEEDYVTWDERVAAMHPEADGTDGVRDDAEAGSDVADHGRVNGQGDL